MSSMRALARSGPCQAPAVGAAAPGARSGCLPALLPACGALQAAHRACVMPAAPPTHSLLAGRPAAAATAAPPPPAAACSARGRAQGHTQQPRWPRRATRTRAASADPAAAGRDAPLFPGSGAAQPLPAEAQQAAAEYVAHCQAAYGRPGLIDFEAGEGGLPKAVLQHPGGARAELYLHGGAVTSWRHADGRELLHLREGNTFNGRDPIRRAGPAPLPCTAVLQWAGCAALLPGPCMPPAACRPGMHRRARSRPASPPPPPPHPSCAPAAAACRSRGRSTARGRCRRTASSRTCTGR